MKVYLIKQLQQNVQGLLNYCKANGIKNLHLNLGLLSNFEIFSREVTIIDKCIDPELLALEEKAQKLAEDKKDFDYRLILSLLSKEDKEKHDKLMIGYNELLQEDRNITLEVIDQTKLVQVITIDEKPVIIPLEFGIDESAMLKFFFDAKNCEKVENEKPAKKKR